MYKISSLKRYLKNPIIIETKWNNKLLIGLIVC